MNRQASIRVLVADDEPDLRQAISDLVEGEDDLELVGAASNATEAAALAESSKPDVAVVDVRMPGGGPEATRLIGKVSPETAVLALSAYEDRATVVTMLRAGAV